MSRPAVKAVLIGDSGVGKTALIQRVTSGRFSSDLGPTIAVGFLQYELNHNGSVVPFQIWDTAGADTYRTLVPIYMRNAQIALLVFDLTNRESFNNVSEWIATLRRSSDECEVALVGNKCDLASEREISFGEGESMQREINAEFYVETSALTGQGAEDLLPQFLDSPRLKGPDMATEQVTVEIATGWARSWCCW
jgi:small GTP-binding protein